MKKALILLSISLTFFFLNHLEAQDVPLTREEFTEIKSQVVVPFLEALKNGDTKTLKKLMFKDKDMYKAKKVLLEQNDAYPEFLRNLYADATFQVGEVKEQDGDIIVHVRINFPNGHQRNIKLHVQNVAESWKVTKNVE